MAIVELIFYIPKVVPNTVVIISEVNAKIPRRCLDDTSKQFELEVKSKLVSRTLLPWNPVLCTNVAKRWRTEKNGSGGLLSKRGGGVLLEGLVRRVCAEENMP